MSAPFSRATLYYFHLFFLQRYIEVYRKSDYLRAHQTEGFFRNCKICLNLLILQNLKIKMARKSKKGFFRRKSIAGILILILMLAAHLLFQMRPDIEARFWNVCYS